MDSKLRRMAIMASMAVILLVSLLVLYINRPPGQGGEMPQTPPPQGQEDAASEETRKPGQIGDDLSAFSGTIPSLTRRSIPSWRLRGTMPPDCRLW